MHEASGHQDNAFVTLTYDEAHLPRPVQLHKAHFQLFMKRLRKFFGRERISYFHCGEYGEQLGRPHFHALLFGVHFPDQVWRKNGPNGSALFESPTLTRLWGMGAALIGAVTFESAAYVARYCVKKVTGEAAAKHYERVDPETGEIYQLEPEYVTMSTRPAIGKRWFEAFGFELEHDDTVVSRGREHKPPRFYDKLREQLDARRFRATKSERIKASKAPRARANSTPERLAVREEVKKSQTNLLRRTLQ